MVSNPNIIGVMARTFLLCLSLTNATQATARMSSDPCAERNGRQPDLVQCIEETVNGIDTVTGEILRIEDKDLFIRRFNGQVVRLHLDTNTQMPGMIGRGDRIEAKVDVVNNEGHALSIQPLK
jgi:hypothetical protein